MKNIENTIISFDNGESLHLLKRQIPINRFESMEDVKRYKEYIHADTVKKNNEHYFFLLDVEDIEYDEL